MLYIKLFWEFFQTGLFAVGGGMATLPFLYDISDRTAWFTHQDLADMIAVSESTPGPIGVNMATYAGYITSGINRTHYSQRDCDSPCVGVSVEIPQQQVRKRSVLRFAPGKLGHDYGGGINSRTCRVFRGELQQSRQCQSGDTCGCNSCPDSRRKVHGEITPYSLACIVRGCRDNLQVLAF